MNINIEAVAAPVVSAEIGVATSSTGTSITHNFLASVPSLPSTESKAFLPHGENADISLSADTISLDAQNATSVHTELIFSVYEQSDKSCYPVSLIVESIKDGVFAELVTEIRESVSANDNKKVKKLKNKLPAFRPAIYLSGKKEVATGIVQFDIDKKDNEALDFHLLRGEIQQIPECIYAYESPTGGLKFGVWTDFAGEMESGEDREALAARFRLAYWKTKKHVQNQMSQSVKFDDSPKSIRLFCFLSHDPQAYFNPTCERLTVNSECQRPEQEYEHQGQYQGYEKYIEGLLSYVPRNLDYPNRLGINFAVLRELGPNGIPVLMAHWNANPLLRQQLEDQLMHCKYGHTGHLIKVAEQYGCEQPKNRARRKLKPIPTDIILEPLKSPDEAKKELAGYVRQFFSDGVSTFINISAGSGKTSAVIEILANEIPGNTNVLFLVPSHELADQIVDQFQKVRREKPCPLDFPSEIAHMYGQSRSCDFLNGTEKLFKLELIEGQPIPWKHCGEHCPVRKKCDYIKQFNHPANIRVMTHHEWFQKSSAWFHGSRTDEKSNNIYPSDELWVPDFVIVDEDVIDLVDAQKVFVDDGTQFPSTKAVLQAIEQGMTLAQAVKNNAIEITMDELENEKPEFPKFMGSVKGYQSAVLAWKKEMKNYSVILERLSAFSSSEDERDLLGMWVKDHKLMFSEVRVAAEEYKGTPTLYLDATAEPRLAARVLPDVRFYSIKLKSKDDVHIHQLANMNVKQADVDKEDFRIELERKLRNLIVQKGYKNVGLVTYKTAENVTGDFDEYLAGRLGISKYEHFGNLRGSNKLEDVDCLLVVGRSFISDKATVRLASAIYGQHEKFDFTYKNSQVRMKDGSCVLLNGATTTNGYHQAVHEHFSVGETKQAIGRARTIFGSQKDVYLFSNESLGTDIEISDFFYWDDFKDNVISAETMHELMAVGFVKNKPSAYVAQLGLSESSVERHRNQIEEELFEAGFKHVTCLYKDDASRKKQWDGYVLEQAKLEKYLREKGMRDFLFHPYIEAQDGVSSS